VTIFSILLALTLVTLFGIAPVLMLVPRTACGSRLLLMPLIGAGVWIVVTGFLAFLGFTGQTISWATMAVGALGLIGYRFRSRLLPPLAARYPILGRRALLRALLQPSERVTAEETRAAGWVVACSVGITVLVIWPYLRQGLWD